MLESDSRVLRAVGLEDTAVEAMKWYKKRREQYKALLKEFLFDLLV